MQQLVEGRVGWPGLGSRHLLATAEAVVAGDWVMTELVDEAAAMAVADVAKTVSVKGYVDIGYLDIGSLGVRRHVDRLQAAAEQSRKAA